MIEAIIVTGNEKIEDIVSIKNECQEYLNMNEYINDQEDINNDTYHVIVYEDNKAVATGKLTVKSYFLIEYILVLNKYRSKYYGDLTVKMLIDKAFRLGAEEVISHTPMEAYRFFERVGFYRKDKCNERGWVQIGIKETDIKKCKH